MKKKSGNIFLFNKIQDLFVSFHFEWENEYHEIKTEGSINILGHFPHFLFG